LTPVVREQSATLIAATVDAVRVRISLPAAPVGLTARAGDGRVTLTWSAVDGVTWSVYRGTTPGGESATPVASGLTSPNYVDAGLANGTMYYYVVRGVLGAALSAVSSEVSATPALDFFSTFGVVAFYDLDGLSDATSNNPLELVGAATFVPGKVGNCLNVGANGQYARRKSTPTLQTGNVDFGIAFWANIASAGSGGETPLVCKTIRANDGDFNSLLFGGHVYFNVLNGVTNVGQVDGGVWTNGVWKFVCCVQDVANNRIGISVDGGAFVWSTRTGTPAAGVRDFAIGSYAQGEQQGGSGKFDQVVFCKPTAGWGGTALMNSFRDQLYNAGAGVSSSILAAGTATSAVAIQAATETGSYLYGVDIGPTALHDPTAGGAGKTIIASAADDAGGGSHLNVSVYDHALATWSKQTGVDTAPLRDFHQAPAIGIDADGFYHVLWGCHIDPLAHVVSNAARDPSAWTVRPDVTAVASYPNTGRFSDGVIYALYRTGVHNSDWSIQLSGDDGDTWEDPQTVLHCVNSGDSFYLTALQDGDTIHLAVVWHDEGNVLGSTAAEFVRRYGVYYFTLNYTAPGTLTAAAADGTPLTLPVTKAQLVASCTVRPELAGIYDNEPSIALDNAGLPALLAVRGSGTSHTLYFTRWTGSAWTTPVTVAAGLDYIADGGLLDYVGSGVWVAFAVVGGTRGNRGDLGADATFDDTGGYLVQYASTDNGATWTRSTWNPGGRVAPGIVAQPAKVVNGVSPFRYVCSEVGPQGFPGRIFAFDRLPS
jgi:hypothetical protein